MSQQPPSRKNGYHRYRLARRMALYILLFSSLVTLVGTGYQLFVDYQNDVAEIEQRFVEIKTSHLANLTNSLWLTHDESVKLQMEGILRLPDMLSVELRQEDGETIFLERGKGEHLLVHRYPLETLFRDKMVTLGTFTVIATLDGVRQRLLDKTLLILATQTVKTFLVSLFILVLFYTLVGRHLHALAEYTRLVRLKHLPEVPPPARRSSSDHGELDELDQLILSITEMVDGLAVSWRQIQVGQELLEEKVRQVNQAESQLRAIINNTPNLIYIKGPEGRYLQANRSFCNYFHVADHQIVGKTDYDFYDEELAAGMQASDLVALTSEVSRCIVDNVLCHDGTRSFLSTKFALLDDNQEPYAVCGVATDITELQRMQKALQHEVQINQALARLARLLISPNFTLRKVTETVLLLAQEVTGSHYGFAMEIDPLTGVRGEFVLSGSVEQACTVERTDGHAVAQGWRLFDFQREGRFCNNVAQDPALAGLPRGHLHLLRLLTMPVLMGHDLVGEIALANAPSNYTQQDLEDVGRLAELYALAISQQRTRQEKTLVEQRLQHAQKMEAVGSLAGGIAHDFNNILAIIISNAELGQLGGKTAEEIYPDVIQACRRGRDLVGQLMTFSRRREGIAIWFDPRVVIAETLRLLRATIPSTVEIRSRITLDAGGVMGDSSQFQQVVMNICSNAVQAMAAIKNPILDLELQVVELEQSMATRLGVAPGRFFMLAIRDNGPGIPESIIERIFDPFFTTKEVGAGTGLGLAVVDGVLRGFKGGVEVENRSEGGAQFRVYFPLVLAKDDAGYEQVVFMAEEANAKKIRVLFLDDEPQLVSVTTKMLNAIGCEAYGFTDPLEALRVFKEQPDAFDLVITDQTMPKMTGREFLCQLHAVRPKLPVYLSTGYDSQALTADQEDSFAGRFQKPVSLDEIKRVLAEFKG